MRGHDVWSKSGLATCSYAYSALGEQLGVQLTGCHHITSQTVAWVSGSMHQSI